MIPAEIANYIQEARRSGMADNQIRDGLFQAGWPISDVEEAFRAAVPEQRPVAVEREQKILLGLPKLLLILGVAAVIAVGGYVGVSYYLSTSKIDDISTWETYRNEEYGFEVKYPDGFFIEENNVNSGVFVVGNKRPSIPEEYKDLTSVRIIVRSRDANDLESWFKNLIAKSVTTTYTRKDDILVDNNKAIVAEAGTSTRSKHIFVLKNGTVVNFIATFGQGDSINFLDQILPTFRFTK